MVKFYLENGDLNAAAVSLDKAVLLAGASADSRRFLELQILTGMLHIYRRDFDSFGRHLVKLKPALGDKSYQSFSNIYNEGAALSDPIDQARLAAGIAMGAGHHAVAARLLLEVFVKKPDDLLTAHLLADAQMHSFDYQGAENTLVHIARNHTDNAEAHFNLARFYLTAFYQPQLARRYAAHAASLKPGDARIELITGLIDYAEGNIAEGIVRIEKLLPKVNDSGMQQICQQIIEDGKHSDQSGQPLDFAGMLALPGAPHAQPGSFRLPGEDALRQGSFLTAMKYFADAGDYAEIGRAYLGMASSFAVSGEKDTAAVAAGFGLGALASELQQNPANGRASLYSALYHIERNDYTTARQILDYGLAGNNDALTRQRLIALRESIDS
jgi:Tfp pilus assembly protein PilF